MAIPKAYRTSNTASTESAEQGGRRTNASFSGKIPLKFKLKGYFESAYSGDRILKILAGLALCYVGLKIDDAFDKYEDSIAKTPIQDQFDFKIGMGQSTAAEAQQNQNNEQNNDSAKDDEKKAPVFNPLDIVSSSEVEILGALAERRKVLDDREKAIDEKKRAIEILQKKILEKTVSLETLQKNIKKMLKTLDTERSEKTRDLVKTYEAMKPKDAAKILNNLDMDIVSGIVMNMSSKKLALIMAQMNINRAKEITAFLGMMNTPFDKEKIEEPNG